ncbi:selenocysteine-specific translation elongation factor [Anaeromicrobium sediminis]|uniref:Selenocysteine-specific elongation factor n=1 Tax=Anaeromicrobium sediminis TaxID=1478221 RepID=A0A267MPP2_9FIRM|nr:selenocysteine-specific translation elongation factor [Anaeromicrobium sediminis]PAB60868.1 selenocysteine-specific translation elongation factor [Anaeromicrobium sediminis]
MKNVVIGTAGHIDHGKSTLIKALTGLDPDRLKEEKKRGITIDLGFAEFVLPSGKRAGVVDVPGHEKFIKNMLAGIGGIDIVLLVIAADEGVMPQTQEHLDILSILEIEKGIVVLTKTDLVDEDWLSLVKEDIKEKLKGTFLEDATMMEVSAVEGKGLDELAHEIDRQTDELKDRNINLPPRIPIDRVFSISGFGTVITGTQIEGTFKVGDEVLIYPNKVETKIRGIQVHGKSVDRSYAGQRVAINLANMKKEDIKRGDVLSIDKVLEPTMMLDVKVNVLKESNWSIKNRSRLRLYHGSSEILCRAVILDKEEILPGESAYIQLRLEEEVVAKRDDKIVLRFYSPMETIGGGFIIDSNPHKHKRFKEDIIEKLQLKEKGDIEDLIEEMIKVNSENYETMKFYIDKGEFAENEMEKVIEKFIEEDKVVKFVDNVILHKDYLEKLEKNIIKELKDFHNKNTLKSGMLKEELRNRVMKKVKNKLYDDLLAYFESVLNLVENKVSLKDFKVTYTKDQEEIKKKIEDNLTKGKFSPRTIKEMAQTFKDENEFNKVIQSMIDFNLLIKLDENIVLYHTVYNEAVTMIKDFIKDNDGITLGQCRDVLSTTRKFALPLLEYLDNNKITKRHGDKRIIN